MAGLCWTAVVLTIFLSIGDTLAPVDQNWLTSIIEGIKNKYALGDTFSLAVNIPQNQDPNDLQDALRDDPADKVEQSVSEGQVYNGTRVVAAAQSEALSHVLENIEPFIKSSQGNFLILYSEESPCGPKCTNSNKNSMAGKINNVIQNWGRYAFVFSKVADVPDAATSQMSESFKRLGISQLGLDNIFRCYKPGDDPFQCTSCSSGGDVTPSCVANNAPSNQDQDIGNEISTVPPTGKDTDLGEMLGKIGEKIATVIGGGTGGVRGEGKGGQVSKCKGCKPRGGGKRGKGGKVGKQCKRRGGCKPRGGGKLGKGGKVGKQCKRRGGCKPRGGGKRGKGGKVRKGHKQRKGGKGKRRGKARGGGRGKHKRGGKGRKYSKSRGGGGKRRKGSRRSG